MKQQAPRKEVFFEGSPFRLELEWTPAANKQTAPFLLHVPIKKYINEIKTVLCPSLELENDPYFGLRRVLDRLKEENGGYIGNVASHMHTWSLCNGALTEEFTLRETDELRCVWRDIDSFVQIVKKKFEWAEFVYKNAPDQASIDDTPSWLKKDARGHYPGEYLLYMLWKLLDNEVGTGTTTISSETNEPYETQSPPKIVNVYNNYNIENYKPMINKQELFLTGMPMEHSETKLLKDE